MKKDNNTSAEAKRIHFYCSSEVFASIIKHKKIWLNDITQSNDYNEVDKYYNELVKAVSASYDNFISKINDPNHYLISKKKKFLDIIIKSINKSRQETLWLATCFSSIPDSLQHWSQYADDGAGFDIEFDEEEISKSIENSSSFALINVKYSSDDFIESTKKMADKIISEIRNSDIYNQTFTTNQFRNLVYKKSSVIYNIIYNVIPFEAVSFKGNAFLNEAETRLVYIGQINQLLNDSKILFSNEFEILVRKSSMLPHLEHPISTDYIKRIIIGPCNKTSPEILQLYLKKYADTDNIEVLTSNVSYRKRNN